MPTDQVTQLHPPLQHYAPCDRDVYGRAVAWYMEGDPNLITAENVRAFVRGWRETGQPCGCKRSQLRTVLDGDIGDPMIFDYENCTCDHDPSRHGMAGCRGFDATGVGRCDCDASWVD